MNDKFTENIKQRMADHTMAEPEGLWQSIEQRLDAAPRQHAAVMPLWVRRAGVAAAAALLLGALAYVLTLGVEHDMAMRVEQIAINEPSRHSATNDGNSTPVLAQSTPVAADASRGDAYRAARVALNMAKAASDLQQESAATKPADNAQPAAATVTDADANATPSVAKQDTDEKTPAKKTYASRLADTDYGTIAENRSNNRSRLSAGIYASGLPTGNSSNGLNSKYYVAQDMMNSSTWTSPTKRNTMPKLHHSMPLNVGVKVRYGITHRLFAETGVSYSYLRSHGDDAQKSYQQRLHYLGVPVDLGYTFWSNNRLKAYVKGGAEMQKLVSGRLTSTYNVVEPFAETESVKERGAQWSVGAGVGFEVKALPKLSIYVEPSVKHYFDNGSTISSTFKDNDTNFSLQVGLRLNP